MMTQRLRAMLMSVGLISLGVVLTGFYQPLDAQISTAALDGTVTDPTGAAIPGAAVDLESVTRTASRKTVTNATGVYVFTALDPDTYQLVVSAKGFTTKTTENIPLASGQGSTLNVTMAVGASVEHVTVTEHAPLLQTTTATLGSEVEGQQFTSLPLLARNFTDMMLVLPGASTPNNTYWQNFSPGGASESGGGDVAFYGQRPRNNEVTMDGALNAELLFDGIPMYPPPEAIAEMKVESGMDSGAYGYASGANINLVTKSGSNNYHFDAWESFRNDDLNARNFFDPTVNRLRWNQFGFSGGGPFVIPRLVSKQKGWYIFGWYEGLRNPSSTNTYGLVPTNAELSGDFSADPVTIYNPYTSVVNPSGVLVSRAPFVNNQIPMGATNLCAPNPTCINPSALTIAQTFYPRQNLPAFSGPGATDYLGTTTGTDTYDQWSVRIDKQIGQKDSIYGRYSDARNPTTSVFYPNLPSIGYLRPTNSVLSWTRTFSPSLVLTTRIGWQRVNDYSITGGPSIAQSVGTYDAFPITYQGIDMIPPIVIAGFGSLSQGFGYYGPENTIFWTVDVQKIHGRNTFGFGGWIGRDAFKTNNQTGTQEEFDSIPTSSPTASNTGYGLASYLLGVPSTAGRVIGSTEGDMYAHYFAAYAQDSVRATPKLTLNLGLRYDYSAPAKNRHGSGTFVWETGQYLYDQTNPITGGAPNAPPGIIPPDYTNFQPRVGLAYQFNPKTTFRASYAIFMDIIGENPQEQQGNRGNWPYAFPQSVAGLNTGLPQYYLQNPFPGPALGSTTPLGCQQCLEVYRSATRTPYVQEWNASVQRQLNSTLMMQVAYFGSHGINQLGQIVDNTAVTPGLGPYQDRQRWPNFPPYVNNGFNQFPSFYDGLSVELRQTTSHNLTYLVAYTWSKTIDVMDSLIVGNIYPFAQPTRFDIPMFKGPASYDVTSRLTASYTWGIPVKTGNKFANAVVANWNLAGVYTFDTGSPYYVLLESDNANIGGVSGRLTSLTNLVGNPRAIQPTINEWFNTSAYQIPPFGTQGNAGKHALYADGMNNWDMAIYKRWPFGESRDVEFRAEFFNGLNAHSFSAPGYVEDSPSTFGVIGGVRQGGRQGQLALKIHF